MEIRNDIEYRDMDIAVVGMALKFPGADSTDQFWENLKNGVISSVDITDDELRAAGVSEKLINDPAYVKKAMPVADIDKFDPDFFGFTPNEAKYMDPQFRILMETAWHALEDAGETTTDDNRTGVFVGGSLSQYMMKNLFSNLSPDKISEMRTMWLENDLNYLATMLSYKLNLRGPSVNVQSACSTSLLAVELACQSLVNFESDTAIAGGVRLAIPQFEGYLYHAAEIQSPNGVCRPFDKKGQGTICGNGAGVVVLKRLNDAIRDKNQIVAVIKGWGANNDGNGKVGYSAPSVAGETDAIMQAQMLSEEEPETITYIEAHGTATELGDPIEFEALKEAFGSVNVKNFCTLGAVKANIGHLDIASGIAGFIKTCLVLKNKQYPPNPTFDEANINIDFENSPFRINKELEDWNPECGVRRAGVSSFGIGGTNVHIVLEEADDKRSVSESEKEKELILFSAKKPVSLQNEKESFNKWLSNVSDFDLKNTAYTYANGRNKFSYRTYEVVNGKKEILADAPVMMKSEKKPKIVFAFPGQGSQYIGMGREFYENEPAYRAAFDKCAELIENNTGVDLHKLIYGSEANEDNQKLLESTDNTHIALFAVEYSCARMLQSYGITPDALIGHSIGEYTAACISNAISLENAVKLVSVRGKIIRSLPSGSMIAVSCGAEDAAKYANNKISLAVINTNKMCVLSGPNDDIFELEQKLKANGLESRRLHVSHAFHSSMLKDGLQMLIDIAGAIEFGKPEIPYMSNVTGTWIKDSDLDPEYLGKHLCGTVKFMENCNNLYNDTPIICIEAGPGNTLEKFIKINLHGKEYVACHIISGTKEGADDHVLFLKSLGELWNIGILDTEKIFDSENAVKISVPGYEFDNRRYWIERKVSDLHTDTDNTTEQIEDDSVAEFTRDESLGKIEEPANELENLLKDILEDIMGIALIGVTDNFIELGGHSLIASQVIARIREELGIEITLADFMKSQDVRSVADLIFERLSED